MPRNSQSFHALLRFLWTYHSFKQYIPLPLLSSTFRKRDFPSWLHTLFEILSTQIHQRFTPFKLFALFLVSLKYLQIIFHKLHAINSSPFGNLLTTSAPQSCPYLTCRQCSGVQVVLASSHPHTSPHCITYWSHRVVQNSTSLKSVP